MAKEPKQLDELFHDTLKDIYFAEKTVDLRYSIECGLTVAEIACFLKRTDAEVQKKAVELGMALHIEGGSGEGRRSLHQCAK